MKQPMSADLLNSVCPQLTEDNEKPTAVCAKKAHNGVFDAVIRAGSGWTRVDFLGSGIGSKSFGISILGVCRIIALICLLLYTYASKADTSLAIREGSYRTLDLGRKASKVVNLNPDIVRVSELDGSTRIRMHGLKTGEAKIEATFTNSDGKIRTRNFSITVTQQQKQQRMTGTGQHNFEYARNYAQGQEKAAKLSELIKKNFKNLSASQLGESLYITGSISSLAEFRKLESLLTQFNLPSIPFYELSDALAIQIVREFNQTWNRSKRQRVQLNYSNKRFFLTSIDGDRESLKPIQEALAGLLPGFEARLSDAENLDQTLVRVTFHFVEASQLRNSEKGQKFSGVQFPLTGSITRNGIDQAPFQYYIKYLNEHMRMKVLEQPELLTHSGQEAVLHSGGDIAFDTYAEHNKRETRFRPYGLSAKVVPRTLLSGSIQIKLQLEVSEPQSTAGSQLNASLLQRKIQTTVTLEDGMAQLIARLKRKKSAGSKAGAPFVENVPVLSWLFSSTTTHAEGSELWIFVSAASDLYSQFAEQDSSLSQLIRDQYDVLPD